MLAEWKKEGAHCTHDALTEAMNEHTKKAFAKDKLTKPNGRDKKKRAP